MQPGQLQNLQRLERQYMQALSQNGWESPVVVTTAVDFANTLIRDGRILLKLGNQTQAEMFFNRAKEITTPISITSGIFYTSGFVRARGHAILQIAQLHESQNQYQKAWMNIRDVLPFMEKFAYTKRVNINEEDQLVLKLYSQLLYHGIENCRMQHRKDDMLDQCNKLVDILQRLGITFESLRKLTKDEFHSEYKKWFTMLARAFYHIGKSQFKVGFERDALRNLYKSWQISELLFGSDAPTSIKARDKYEKLSQKMEFEMIMGSEKVDFQQFKAELQKDVGQDLLRKAVNLKPNKNFNHHILQQVKSYQQIVTQLTSHSSKYQMPEYVKKVRQDYEDKLRTLSDQKQISDEQQKFTKYIIKNKKSSSRAASTYMNQSMLPQDRLFSPRMSNTQSQRISVYQNLMDNQIDQLKEYLQNTELKQQPVNDMMLMRPQFKSEHVQPQQLQQKINIKETQKYKSNRLIQKSINRQQTNIINKSETQQSEQKIAKIQTVSELNAQQVEEVRMQTTESQAAQSPLQLIQLPLLQNVRTEITEPSDNLITEYLSKYTIEELNIAATKIQKHFRKYHEQKKLEIQIDTPDITPLNIIKPMSQTQTSEKIDSVQTGRNQMKMSVKDMKNSLRKGAKNFGFDSIVKEIKQTESDQSSSNKAKTVFYNLNQLISIIVEFFHLPEQDLYFLDKLFFDHEVKIWRLSNISLRAFNQQQASQQTEEEEQQLPIDNPPIEIKHQLQHIMNMFTNIQSIKALQLIVYFTISNDKKQYTINFKIQNFVSYLDEYQRWFSKDRLENFNGLLGIYCKQQNLFQPTGCRSLVLHPAEFTTQLVSRLVYTLRNHYYLMRSVLGYKIISMREVVERELQNDIIDVRIIQKNDRIKKEEKRQMLMKYLKIEPLKIQEKFQEHIPTTSLSSTRMRQKFQYTEELNIPQEDSIVIHNSEKSQISEQKSGKTIIQSSITPTDRLQYSKNKSIDNTQDYEQMIQQQIRTRSPKKQYSVINSRYTTTLASPRNIVASQALIKSAAIRPHGSHFLDLSKREYPKSKLEPPTDREQKLSIDDSLRTRSKSDVELLQEYFPEFNYANLDDFANYEPQEGPVIQFSDLKIKNTYFPPQGHIIYPEPEELQFEYPDSCVILNFTMKNEDGRIVTGFLHLDMGETYLISDDQIHETIKRKFPLQLSQRLLDKEEKSKILAILQNKEIPPKPQNFIEQMLANNYRHVSILLDRYISRINHYDITIQNEVHQQLQSNQILPLTTIINLSQSERNVSIVQELQNQEILFQSLIQVTEGLPLTAELPIQGKYFRTYQSPFDITTNKFYIKDQNLYCKIEVCFKEVKVFDTKLLYLSDQQAKQDLIVLRKQMHQLIGKQEVQVKMRQYYPNQRITFYRSVNSLQDIEKVLHMFQKPKLVCHQIKAQARVEHRLIGKALQIGRKAIGMQERHRDKFSSLDQFLLLYIKDPAQMGSSEKSRLLKQTILFYYFKQQLKLTLISSSRLSYFMKTYFIRRSFNAQSRVSNIGKVFVECEVYQFNKFYIDQEMVEHTYFYFQITPQESRTKLFKLVLDLADICSICPKVCAENCFKDRVLHDIINTLTAYLVCYKTNTYHGLKIPLSYITNQSKYDLHNTFKEVTYGNNLLEDQTNARQSQPRLSMLMNDSQLRSKCQTQIMDIQIENLQLPEEANRILKNTSMLTPVFRGQKFIYKTTKVVNSMYIIITVQFLSMGIFQLGIYIPQTCRNFCCYIQQSDFRNMSPIFLESIFPSALVTKETLDQFYVNRWKFSEISRIYLMAINHPEEFDDFFSEMRSQARAIPQIELQKLTESRLSLQNEDELIEKPYDETPKLFESFSDQSRQNLRSSTQPPVFVKKQFSKQFSVQNSLGNQVIRLSLPNTAPNQSKVDKSLFFKHSPRMSHGSMENFYSTDRDLFFNSLLIRKNNLDMISTFEIKIWESLINKMSITKNKQNHFIFNMDSFQGVLRENLYTQVVYLGNEVNALFEVFVENVRKPLDMFKNFLPIRLNESQNFSMYQRITLFEMPKTVNFKLMLRKVLFTVLDQYEFIQSDIQKCAVYMLNMLKKQFKLDSSKFIIQEVQTDEKCPQLIKVNANYKQFAALQHYQYTLLKRMIFTMRPTKIYVSIFYREKRKKFYLYFESMKNCKNTTIKYSLLEIQKCIPSAISLLNLGLHQELGQRIFQSFKNRLLVQTYQQLV